MGRAVASDRPLGRSTWVLAGMLLLGCAAMAQGGLANAPDRAPGAAQSAPEALHAQATGAWERRTLDTPEGPRSVVVYAPPAHPDVGTPRPLVVALHGNGGTGEGMAEMTAFARLADREGFVVAFPDGIEGAWNYVRGIPGYPDAPDDTTFLRTLATELRATLGTDPERTYVVGYSNGGFMAQRLACDAPDVFAAFVAVAAGGFAGLDGVCPPGPPASVAMIHGTADTNVPWDGLPVRVPGGVVEITWPLPATFAWWAERAACELPATRSELAGNAEQGYDRVIVFSLETCADDRRVALFGMPGGGHAWPAGQTFDASVAAWAFLRDQTLP